MYKPELDRARKHERKLARRAARARRSKWLGRLLFSLTGVAMMLGLRANPEVVEDVVAWAVTANSASAQAGSAVDPTDQLVSAMPRNSVPVRRANSVSN
jgi:hypothetical protein